jgi:hypothetical protein
MGRLSNGGIMEVYKKVKNDLMFFCIVYLFFIWLTGGMERDSTDGERRSGMALRIDAMTGCHYLEGAKGGMTPRLNREGHHICEGL